MIFQVYDSAYYSKENNFSGRYVLWGLENKTNLPLCVNLYGTECEAFLELPKVAVSRMVDWGENSKPQDRIVRMKLLNMFKGNAEVTIVKRFGLLEFQEEQRYYLRAVTEKREELDLAIQNTRQGLTDIFNGAAPVWRETELDPMTKLFMINQWDRSGWFKISVPLEEISSPHQEISVKTIKSPCVWTSHQKFELGGVTRESDRPVRHVYVHVKDLEFIKDPVDLEALPMIGHLDFEAIRGDGNGFPNPILPTDFVYMCSYVHGYLGQPVQKYCICTGYPAMPADTDITIISVETEAELYDSLMDLINVTNPDVISGYNIHGFDLKYMESRAAIVGQQLRNVSRLPGKFSDVDFLRGPRGARYTNLKCPGRIVLDLLLYLIKNTSRQDLPSFSLKSVTKFYLSGEDDQKIDLSYTDQFKLFAEYILGFPSGPAGLARIVEYCVRDSDVLPKLFVNRDVWPTCIAFSNILGCTIQVSAVAGQVERLTPLLYKYVRRRDTVMEVNPHAGKMKPDGGFVYLAKPGRYSNICIGDFASLYPSIIISMNLCWSTRVREDQDLDVIARYPGRYSITEATYRTSNTIFADDPDDCVAEANGEEPDDRTIDDGKAEPVPLGTASESVIDPDEIAAATGTEATDTDPFDLSDIRRAKRAISERLNVVAHTTKVVYVSSDVKLGILPEALKTLLAERNFIRKKVMPKYEKELKALSADDVDYAVRSAALSRKITDLDIMQTAVKVAANSIYGIMGAFAPYADPFVCMCTTANGRRLIQASTQLILDRFPTCKYVYTDTDSSMISGGPFDALPSWALLAKFEFRLEDFGIDPSSLPADYAEGANAILKDYAKSTQKLAQLWVRPIIENVCVPACAIPDKAGIYTDPMKFEYEGFVPAGIWFSKKFYIARILGDDGKYKMKERGILLRRGDYPTVVKNVYGHACFGFLDNLDTNSVLRTLRADIQDLLCGKPLPFNDCCVSSDFKSISEYKMASAKMAILAREAERLGVPIQDNSRVDYAMVSVHGDSAPATMSSMLASTKRSEGLATRDMFRILGETHAGAAELDRDYYLKVISNPVDKLLQVAAGCDLEGYYVRIYNDEPRTRLITPTMTPEERAADTRPCAFEFNMFSPMKSLLNLMKLTSNPNATLRAWREFNVRVFARVIEVYCERTLA
jgi:DNA polymerase elongation subunit (family B)